MFDLWPSQGWGGAWDSKGNIYFRGPGSVMWKLPAEGDESAALVELNTAKGDQTQSHLSFLPGAEWGLSGIWRGGTGRQSRVVAVFLETGEM